MQNYEGLERRVSGTIQSLILMKELVFVLVMCINTEWQWRFISNVWWWLCVNT